MSECGTWPIGWPGPVNIGTTSRSNGNCWRLGIHKRANYLTTSESVKGWTHVRRSSERIAAFILRPVISLCVTVRKLNPHQYSGAFK
jgi:hypothetical protein